MNYKYKLMTVAEIHAESLRLGNLFREMYTNPGDYHDSDRAEALDNYIEARRAIPRDFYGNRPGAFEAYKSTQEAYNPA